MYKNVCNIELYFKKNDLQKKYPLTSRIKPSEGKAKL